MLADRAAATPEEMAVVTGAGTAEAMAVAIAEGMAAEVGVATPVVGTEVAMAKVEEGGNSSCSLPE
jgi:threonine dehydrogenase-like Zn-dependent dehydrogenase